MKVAPLPDGPAADSDAVEQLLDFELERQVEVVSVPTKQKDSDICLESPTPEEATGVMTMSLENEPVASLPNFSAGEQSHTEQSSSFISDSFAENKGEGSFIENSSSEIPGQRKKRRKTVKQLRAVKRLSIQSKQSSRAGSLEQRSSLDFGRKSPDPNGRETPQQNEYVEVGLIHRVIEAIKENVELPLIEGTSTRVFLLCVAGVLAVTLYYFVQLVLVAAVTQYADPPGKFLISFEKKLETPSVRICPDQVGIDLTSPESFGFTPKCATNRDQLCDYVKVPDFSGDDTTKECYVFNIANKALGTPFYLNNTHDSITIVFAALVDPSNEGFSYYGVPFTFVRSTDYNSTFEFPRNGYIRMNSVSMVNILLRKHISINKKEKWTFYSPGLVSLKLSDPFAEYLARDVVGVPEEMRSNYSVFALNLRYSSMQVTSTQEYYPYGPLEIIAALGGIVSLGLGIMQALYPKQKKIVRRFVLDVLEDVEGDEDETDSEDEVEEPVPQPPPAKA